MKRISIHIVLLSFCALFGACSSWFDVQPKRLTPESKLFSTETGFKEALTGIYIKAAKDSLYGKKLTYDMTERLAQRYVGVSDESYYDFSGSGRNAGLIVNLWSDSYNLIANINNLLTWIDKRRDVLKTPGYYEIIKGEALALRSYVYFDLLRLFGPIYSQEPSAKSIPYRTQFNRDDTELEKADAMLGYIIRDLLEAHDLLDGVDNLDFSYITEDGRVKTAAGVGEDPFLAFRFKRMNLLAVKALLARVYLYQGDANNAVRYANEVIMSGKFVILSTMKTTKREPLGELIFGLDYDKTDVPKNRLLNTSYHIEKQQTFDEMFEVDEYGMNDMRVKIGSGFVDESGNFTSLKYDVSGVIEPLQYTVPLLRLPEMYYILAECADNMAQARSYLDVVRTTRGLEALPELTSQDDKLKALEMEYRKEFYAEGQSWYFYKRHFFRSFHNCPVEEMSPANYIFKVPDDEFSFGGISR